MKGDKPLKLGLLTRDAEGDVSSIHLKEALEKVGHKVILIQYSQYDDDRGNPNLYWHINDICITKKQYTDVNSKVIQNVQIRLDEFDGVMMRALGKANVALEYAKFFEQSGVLVVNSTADIERSDSKILTTLKLQAENILMPKSTAYNFVDISNDKFPNVIDEFGNTEWPIVIKPGYETGGKGLFFPQDREEAIIAIHKIKNDPIYDQKGFVIQEFVKTAHPVESYRALVIAGEAAIIWKVIAEGDSLVANGGNCTKVDDLEIKEMAQKAAETMNLDLCSGVDFVRREDGKLFVLEINDGPNLRNIIKNREIPAGRMIAKAFVNKVLSHKAAKFKAGKQEVPAEDSFSIGSGKELKLKPQPFLKSSSSDMLGSEQGSKMEH